VADNPSSPETSLPDLGARLLEEDAFYELLGSVIWTLSIVLMFLTTTFQRMVLPLKRCG
jgi:hypothetical protein